MQSTVLAWTQKGTRSRIRNTAWKPRTKLAGSDSTTLIFPFFVAITFLFFVTSKINSNKANEKTTNWYGMVPVILIRVTAPFWPLDPRSKIGFFPHFAFSTVPINVPYPQHCFLYSWKGSVCRYSPPFIRFYNLRGGGGVTTWKARSAVSHILVFQSLLGQTYIYFFVWDGGDTCFKYPFLFLTRGPKNTFLGGFSVFFLGVFFYCQPWSDQRYESGSFHQKT